MMLQDDTLMSLEQLLLSPDIDKKIRILSVQIMDRDAFQIGDSCEHRSISARSIEARMCEKDYCRFYIFCQLIKR